MDVPSLVAQTALALGVDPQLALAVAEAESNFNPNAVNPSSGAAGVMQLMPATARGCGVTNIFDPAQNIRCGVGLLRDLLSQYGGDVAKALAGYDWGSGRVDAAVAAYGDAWLDHAPGETQSYVGKIAGAVSYQPSAVSVPDSGQDSSWLALALAGGVALWALS